MIAALLILATVTLVIVGLVYFMFDPAQPDNIFPPCPIHHYTGLECPGCGTQRAIHHLLHFNIWQAFSSNPLMVLSFPYILTGVYFEYFGGRKRYPELRKILFGRNAAIIVFIIILLYFIIRNVL